MGDGAESSLYLAETYQVNVIAADLWRDPTDNARKTENRGQKDNVIPLKLDASKPLPFAEQYFDAILRVNNLNFFGKENRPYMTVYQLVAKRRE